jgi:MFS family permease
MNSLGAGGAQSPYLVNAANALVFGLMGIFCLLGGPIANRIGLKYTLLLGAVGYPIYSAGLYTNNRYGNVWFVLVGAVACGVSAGLFWSSEGAVALGYPEASKRGKYMNIWLIFRTGGPLVGGAIVLALNHGENQKGTGKVGYQTYLVFIALQCLSVPIALALSPPQKVQRTDNTKVKIVMEASFVAELKALGRCLKRRDIILLLPVFWAAYFNQYIGNFQTYYFGVRARALMGFVVNFGTLLSSWLISTLLDYKKFPVKKRLNIGFYYVIFLHLLSWSYGWAINEKYTRTQPKWDWEDAGFVEGFFVVLLWSMSDQRSVSSAHVLMIIQISHSNPFRIGCTILCPPKPTISLNLVSFLQDHKTTANSHSTLLRYPTRPGEFLASRLVWSQYAGLVRRTSATGCEYHSSWIGRRSYLACPT